MSLTLDLPVELEQELAEEAERRGLSLPEYALLVLATGLPLDKPPTNGAELIAFWKQEGLIGSRPDIDDTDTFARNLRRQAENRERE